MARKKKANRQLGPLVGIAASAVIVGSVLIGHDALWVPFATVAAAIVAFFGWKFVRSAARDAILSESTLVAEGPVPLGGVAYLRLGLSPKKPIPLNSAKLTFYTQERALYDAGTNHRVYKEVIGTWETPLDVPAVLEEDLYRTVRVPIPRDIPPTFHGLKNHLESKCVVYLDIPNWPDVELEAEVVVLPEVLHG